MKNPFFLALIWILFFFLESLLPWSVGDFSIRIYGSYFVLGYTFFVLPFFTSLFFAAFVFVVQSAYSHDPLGLLFLEGFLYLFIFWVRHKTFSENLAARGLIVWVALFIAFFLLNSLREGRLSWPSSQLLPGLLFFFQWVLNGLGAISLFWFLDEPGSIWEENLLAFRAKRGQLHLFEARHLKGLRRSRFKIQQRVRRRFGLRDSW